MIDDNKSSNQTIDDYFSEFNNKTKQQTRAAYISTAIAASLACMAGVYVGTQSKYIHNQIQHQEQRLETIKEDQFFISDPCYDQEDTHLYDATPCYNKKTE